MKYHTQKRSELIVRSDPIQVDKFKEALAYRIKYTQQMYFQDGLNHLQRNIPVLKSNKIHKFVPFVHKHDGLKRMRGRIDRASLTYSQRDPIILPGL